MSGHVSSGHDPLYSISICSAPPQCEGKNLSKSTPLPMRTVTYSALNDCFGTASAVTGLDTVVPYTRGFVHRPSV